MTALFEEAFGEDFFENEKVPVPAPTPTKPGNVIYPPQFHHLEWVKARWSDFLNAVN